MIDVNPVDMRCRRMVNIVVIDTTVGITVSVGFRFQNFKI